MAAYLIADVEVTDRQGFTEYMRLAPPLIATYGGRYIVRGGAYEVLEGTWRPRRAVVIEFPSKPIFDTFWHSAEYQPLKQLRERSARSNLIVVEGVPPEASMTEYPLELIDDHSRKTS